MNDPRFHQAASKRTFPAPATGRKQPLPAGTKRRISSNGCSIPALGPSRGGFSTKSHDARADGRGRRLDFVPPGGEACDSGAVPDLLAVPLGNRGCCLPTKDRTAASCARNYRSMGSRRSFHRTPTGRPRRPAATEPRDHARSGSPGKRTPFHRLFQGFTPATGCRLMTDTNSG